MFEIGGIQLPVGGSFSRQMIGDVQYVATDHEGGVVEETIPHPAFEAIFILSVAVTIGGRG